MKKLIILFFYFICLGLPAFAETTSEDNTVVTCPKEVQCMVSGNLGSCYVSEDPYKIWADGYKNNRGSIVKGIYKFKGAYSGSYHHGYVESYQTHAKIGFVYPIPFPTETCEYSITDNLGVERLIGLHPNGPALEPFLYTSSNWVVEGADAGLYLSECLSNNPQLCSLTELPEVLYSQEKDKPGYLYFEYYDDEYQSKYHSTTVFYNQLLATCGATSVCKIDVGISKDNSSNNEVKIGTMTVDISKANFVKIVTIDTEASSTCIIKKRDSFNVIYCDPKRTEIGTK